MMQRASGARLDPRAYPLSVQLHPRFGDLDPLGHVNNVSLARIVEDARSRLMIDIGVTVIAANHGSGTAGGGRLVTAAAHYEYLAEVFYPAPLTIYLATLHIGRTSFSVTQLAMQEGHRVCVHESVLTLLDERGPMPLTPALREIVAGVRLSVGLAHGL